MYPDIEFTGEVKVDRSSDIISTYSSVGGTLLSTLKHNNRTTCYIDSDKYLGNLDSMYEITDEELKSNSIMSLTYCSGYNSLTGNLQIELGKKITDNLYAIIAEDNEMTILHWIKSNGNVVFDLS